jgi:hypothetical protein
VALVIVVCVVVPVAAGLVENRWVRSFAKTEVQGWEPTPS